MPADDPPRLRVVSYNIKSWRGDQAALSATVRDLAPDVLVLQEVLRWADPRTWCVDLAGRFGMAHAFGGLTACGNAVLTGSAVTMHGGQTLRYPWRFGESPRAAVLVRCSVGAVEFVAAGSHLSTGAAVRQQQATLLKGALESAGAPVVAGLDVNETDTGPAWQTIASGLVDAAQSTGQAGTPTYSTSRPERRIDAIFADPALPVLGYRVADTPQARVASDHFPILAELGR